MKMLRKGISPLIATVLIIGFTVALAAIIMTWGTTFSKGMQKSTEATTEEQMSCAQDVVFDLSSACVVDADSIKLTLKNDGSKDIINMSIRFYVDGNNVQAANVPGANLPLMAYGIKTVQLDGITNAATVTLVEGIPVIKVGEKTLTCAATKDYIGDQNYEDALIAC
ncbi:MAG: archaellin/type IV pilin N-terminal domain-containing protein [Nanoarchaeota archaeon]